MRQRTDQKTFPQKSLLFVLALAAVGLLVGSFADLRLSRLLYSGESSLFAGAVASFGELPLYLCFFFAGTSMFRGLSRERALARLIAGGSGAALILLPAAVYARRAVQKAVFSIPVCLAVCGALCLLSCLLLWFFVVRGARRRDLMRASAAAILAAVLTVAAVKGLKLLWGRPRMYFVYENGAEFFRSWWQAGTSLKKELTAAGASADAFKSFPSGHTASAALLLLLPLLSEVRPRLRGRENLLLLPGLLYTLLVSFFRILAGAHFLSDVSAGLAVSVCCILAAEAYCYRGKRQKT